MVQVRSSILDHPHPGLDPHVWDQDGKLLPEHKELIEKVLLDHINEEGLKDHDKWIKKVKIIGGITTYQYTFDSDIDIHIETDLEQFIKSNHPDWTPEQAHEYLNEFRARINQQTPKIPNTEHLIEYYFETPFVNKEGSPRSGLYNVYTNEWEEPPITVDMEFSIEELAKSVVDAANEVAKELDISFGTIRRDVRRIEDLRNAADAWDGGQKKKYENRIQERLTDIEAEIAGLVLDRDDIIEDRRNYDPMGDAEIKFKYLQRFGYINLITTLYQYVKDDGRVTEDEVPDIRQDLLELGLKEASLEKEAGYLEHAYWVAPDDTVFEVRGESRSMETHYDWIRNNVELLENYGIEVTPENADSKSFEIADSMIQAGWIRIGDSGTDWGVTVKDIDNIPSIVDDILSKFLQDDHRVIVENSIDGSDVSVEIIFPWKSIQQAVNKAFQRQRLGKKAAYEYSCVMVDIPNNISKAVQNWGKENIPDEDIYEGTGDEADNYGREDKTHVTVLFGLHTNKVDEIKELFKDQIPPKIKLGKVSYFSLDDKPYDVVIVEIVSPDLHKLNKLLTDNFEYTNDHPKYKPHMTVAYVKRGKAEQYEGKSILDGDEVDISKVIFSPAEGEKSIFELNKTASEKDSKSWPGAGKLMIDFDNTIADNDKADYPEIGDPFPEVKEALEKLKDKGWEIIIYSCRANNKKGIDDIKEFLNKHEIPYDDIFEGKPHAEYYIDDRNVMFTDWKDVLKQVKKKADITENAYWIAPDGKVFTVREEGQLVTHTDWTERHLDTLLEYGIVDADVKISGREDMYAIVDKMYEAGWTRVGDAMYPLNHSVTLKDIRHIPDSVQGVLENFLSSGEVIEIAETQGGAIAEVTYPWNSLQKAVNDSLRQPALAKKAEFMPGITPHAPTKRWGPYDVEIPVDPDPTREDQEWFHGEHADKPRNRKWWKRVWDWFTDEEPADLDKEAVDNPMTELDDFTRAYLEAAIWSSSDQTDDQGGAPLDENYSITDISDEFVQQAIKDGNAFREKAGDLLNDIDYESAGHDFWLTRNGHGAGFWDRGYGEIGDKLTELSESFGEAYLSVDDVDPNFRHMSDETVEDRLENTPTLDINKKRDQLLDQFNVETDPQKKEKIKQMIDNLRYASKKEAASDDANQILQLTQQNGGATWNFSQGNLVGTESYSVSTHLDRTQKVSADQLTPEVIEAYVAANQDLLSDSNNSMGTWNDGGTVYLDVVTTVADRDQAIELGRQHNQKAIFDLKNLEEISTGGTGEVLSAYDGDDGCEDCGEETDNGGGICDECHKRRLKNVPQDKKSFWEAGEDMERYWIDPNGKVVSLGQSATHAMWISDNMEMLNSTYGKNFKPMPMPGDLDTEDPNPEEEDEWLLDESYAYYSRYQNELISDGWTRAGDVSGTSALGLQVADLRNIPGPALDFILSSDMMELTIEDLSVEYVTLRRDQFPNAQKEINRELTHQMAANKEARPRPIHKKVQETDWMDERFDLEPFSPLPTTFQKDINEKNLNWRHPWRYMGRPKGKAFTDQGDMTEILLQQEQPLSDKDAASGTTTVDTKYGGRVRVYKNPTVEQVIKIHNDVGQLRWFSASDGNIFFWDAWNAEHAAMIPLLGYDLDLRSDEYFINTGIIEDEEQIYDVLKTDKVASTYTDKEMEEFYVEQHDYNDSDGGGNDYHDWMSNTNDFPKPEDLERPKVRLDRWYKTDTPIPSYEVTWVFSLPKGGPPMDDPDEQYEKPQ